MLPIAAIVAVFLFKRRAQLQVGLKNVSLQLLHRESTLTHYNHIYKMGSHTFRPDCPCQTRGSIHLIVGPMFSGKTTELFRLTKRYILAGKKTIIIKYAKDKRYSHERAVTHDRNQMDALVTLKIKDVYNHITHYDIIGIDEGQFFTDIVPYAQKLADHGKTVLVAALNGDFLRKPFQHISTLFARAERIEKLSAVCRICGHSASFTYRTITHPDRELIGGTESYQAVCRLCYINLYKRKIVASEQS